MPKQPVRRKDTIFYSDGSRTETSTKYYKNGKPRSVEVIEYDAAGNETKNTKTWVTSAGKITHTSVTETGYHTNGERSVTVTKESSGQDGNLDRTTEDRYDNKGEIQKRTVEAHFRDRRGRRTNTRTTTFENKSWETYDQKYDPETGRKVGIPEEVILEKWAGLHPLWH